MRRVEFRLARAAGPPQPWYRGRDGRWRRGAGSSVAGTGMSMVPFDASFMSRHSLRYGERAHLAVGDVHQVAHADALEIGRIVCLHRLRSSARPGERYRAARDSNAVIVAVIVIAC